MATNQTVTIDRSKTLDEMIAVGHYDWSLEDISAEHFPVDRNGPTEVLTELVHIERSITSEDAIKEMDARGLRPATIEELLAFGATYPDLQRKFPIVALGSLWQDSDDRQCVAHLYGSAKVRNLDVDWLDGEWPDRQRFLAVRK